MLGFLRRYQRILFIAVTAVIIVSFSLVGTYRNAGEPTRDDTVAFQTIDGRPVTRSWLTKMVRFCGSDAIDKFQNGGVEGPNFLNDGIIRNDFLRSGLATMLAASYGELIESDLQLRTDREKRYTPYAHPQAPFLGADAAWAHFAPAIKREFEALKDADDPLSAEMFDKRVNLYLAEAEFPQYALKQVLHFQQGQHDWLRPDPYLARRDLALFNYHTLEDWFGGRFLNIACEFVINGSILAKEKGYHVTRQEALADLMQNAANSFAQNRGLIKTPNAQSYFQEQLRILGMSKKEAIDIWQQVMLFRRFFHDVGHTALLDSFAFEKFHAYAQETVEVEVVGLPEALWLEDYAALQAFECYSDAIALESDDLPTKLRPIAEIEKSAPELITQRYVVEVAKVQKNALRREIPIKKVWEWELEKKHFSKLSKEFPVLAAARASNRQERFEALSNLDKPTRSQVDRFSENQMLDQEHVEEMLAKAPAEHMEITVPLKGGKSPLAGLNDRKKLLKLLEKDQFSAASDDGETLYRIAVLERDSEKKLLTFAEAREKDVLKGVVNRKLRAHHKKMGLDAPFAEVRGQVTDDLFAPLLKNIFSAYKGSDRPVQPTGEFAAHHRFDRYLQTVQERGETETLEQWKLIHEELAFKRGESETFDPFTMDVGSTSSVLGGKERSAFFFTVTESKPGAPDDSHIEKAHEGLAFEAQRKLMQQLLNEVNQKEAISLAFLGEME